MNTNQAVYTIDYEADDEVVYEAHAAGLSISAYTRRAVLTDLDYDGLAAGQGVAVALGMADQYVGEGRVNPTYRVQVAFTQCEAAALRAAAAESRQRPTDYIQTCVSAAVLMSVIVRARKARDDARTRGRERLAACCDRCGASIRLARSS